MKKQKNLSREELEQIAKKGATDADISTIFAIAELYGSSEIAELKERAQQYLRTSIGEAVKNTSKFKDYLYELNDAYRDANDCGYFPALVILEEMAPSVKKSRDGK